MKKLITLCLLLLSFLIITSCNNTEIEEALPPVLEININQPINSTIEMGQRVDYIYTINSTEDIAYIEISNSSNKTRIDIPINTTVYNDTITFIGEFLDINNRNIISILVGDVQGNRSTKQISIEVTPPSQSLPINSFIDVKLTKELRFLDIDRSRPYIYNITEVLFITETIDFVYVPSLYGNDPLGSPMLGSPKELGGRQWAVKNDIKFRKVIITREDFEQLDGLGILNYYYNGQNSDSGNSSFKNKVNYLNYQEAFCFETNEGRKGIAFITGIVTSIFYNGNGELYMDIKILE